MGYMIGAMDTDVRHRALSRIRRIQGQVAAIERMIGEDRYCVDVLLQVTAARAALDALGKRLLQTHIEHCVMDAVTSGRPKERQAKIAELMDVFSRFSQIGGR